MKQYFNLALKYLIGQKKISISCIIAIIYKIEYDVSWNNAKKVVGYFDARFENLTKNQANKLKSIDKIKDYSFYKNLELGIKYRMKTDYSPSEGDIGSQVRFPEYEYTKIDTI